MVDSAACTPDGRSRRTAFCGVTARDWGHDSGEGLPTPQGQEDAVVSGASWPDGRPVLAASSGSTATPWSLDSSECLPTLRGRGAAVLAGAPTPDGRWALTDQLPPSWPSRSQRPPGRLGWIGLPLEGLPGTKRSLPWQRWRRRRVR